MRFETLLSNYTWASKIKDVVFGVETFVISFRSVLIIFD